MSWVLLLFLFHFVCLFLISQINILSLNWFLSFWWNLLFAINISHSKLQFKEASSLFHHIFCSETRLKHQKALGNYSLLSKRLQHLGRSVAIHKAQGMKPPGPFPGRLSANSPWSCRAASCGASSSIAGAAGAGAAGRTLGAGGGAHGSLSLLGEADFPEGDFCVSGTVANVALGRFTCCLPSWCPDYSKTERLMVGTLR